MNRIIKPEELPTWVPGDILVASDNLGWQGVGQRTYRYTGLDVPIPPLDHFMLVRYGVGSTKMDRWVDGRWTRSDCQVGDVSLLTMHEPSHWHWKDNIDVSHIYLNMGLMRRVAEDMTDKAISDVALHDALCVRDPLLVNIIDSITAESTTPGLGGSMYAEALGVQLAVHLLRNYATVNYREIEKSQALAGPRLKLVKDYIDAHLHEALSVEMLADVAQMGIWTFSRQFRDIVGTPPYAYIIERRIKKARLLLMTTDQSIKQIAAVSGFSDQAHLSRTLQAQYGLTPMQIRKEG